MINPNSNKISPLSSKLIKVPINFVSSLFFGYFSYSTVKEVKIYSLFIAFIYRSLQTAILTYIIGYYDEYSY